MRKSILLFLLALGCVTTYAQTADELYQKAKTRNEKKDYSGAVALIDKAIALKPTCDYYYIRAIYVHNTGDKEGAQKQARDIIDIFPDSVNAWMNASSFFIAIQDFDRSLEIADSMIAKFTDVVDSVRFELYMFRGAVKTGMNDHAAAESDFKVAYAIDSTNEEVLIDLAGVNDELGRDEEAVRLMKKALAINPDNGRLYNNLGFLYDNMGRYKEAIEMFNTSIARNKGKDDFGSRETTGFSYSNRGHAKYKLGDKAKEEADKIPALFPDSIMEHIRTAIFFNDVQDFDHAVEVYDGIFKSFPAMHDTTKVSILNNRGSSKHSMNDAAGAKADYDIAYAIDSMDISIMINLAGVYDDLGKPEESVRLLLKVIKLEPKNNSTYNNLGFIYNNMGKYKEAIDIFNQSIDLIKNNKDYESQQVLGFTYSNRGHAKYKLGDNKGALKDFEKSIELAPSNSYVFKNRALVYIAMKKNKEACLDLYRAISLGFSDMYGNEVEKLINAYCR